MVVERGLARCPRCVTVADYVFIESESGAMRYEVHCRKCGERYGEKSLPWAPPPRVGSAPPIQWPPDCEPAPRPDWRREVRQRLTVSARRGGVVLAALRAHAHHAARSARTQVRALRGKDQTGG
jgi:hypothetical protein